MAQIEFVGYGAFLVHDTYPVVIPKYVDNLSSMSWYDCAVVPDYDTCTLKITNLCQPNPRRQVVFRFEKVHWMCERPYEQLVEMLEKKLNCIALKYLKTLNYDIEMIGNM